MVVRPPYAVAKETLGQRLREFGRAWYSLGDARGEFRRNVADWAAGGPPGGGWTRTGPPVQTPECRLVWVQRRLVEAEECIAKNRPEWTRWHLDFLRTYRDGGDLEGSAYWLEYLSSRYTREIAARKSARFLALYENIAKHGWRRGSYVQVADLASMPGLTSLFGFRYFRFNGAHRLACLYTLGVRQIPCLVYSVRSYRQRSRFLRFVLRPQA